jgi:hypothetical protein
MKRRYLSAHLLLSASFGVPLIATTELSRPPMIDPTRMVNPAPKVVDALPLWVPDQHEPDYPANSMRDNIVRMVTGSTSSMNISISFGSTTWMPVRPV